VTATAVANSTTSYHGTRVREDFDVAGNIRKIGAKNSPSNR